MRHIFITTLWKMEVDYAFRTRVPYIFHASKGTRVFGNDYRSLARVWSRFRRACTISRNSHWCSNHRRIVTDFSSIPVREFCRSRPVSIIKNGVSPASIYSPRIEVLFRPRCVSATHFGVSIFMKVHVCRRRDWSLFLRSLEKNCQLRAWGCIRATPLFSYSIQLR